MIKISRPAPKDIYPRHRLFEQLDYLRRFPIIWVSAPAGYGKTSLVSSYIEHRNIPSLWYQFDQTDADLSTFFYYMGKAARYAAPRKRLSLPLLTPEFLQGIPTFTLHYFEKLYEKLTPPFFLVFDNYHEIPGEAPLHDVMNQALSMIPEGIHVAVLSRNDVPAHFSRLRANRSIGIIESGEMQFTEGEAGGMLEQGDKSPPSQKTLHRLYEISQGWAAGLILLHEASRKAALPSAFNEKEMLEVVFDYFVAEVFRHLNQETRNFFLTTAFFPRMTVQMAKQLTGNKSAGSILRTLNRNNYFVLKRSGPKITYEYHPLYRQFLMNRAEAIFSPDDLSSIRRDAAVILDSEGMTEDAITLLKETAGWDILVGIVLSKAPEIIKQGRYPTLQDWLETLPEAVVERNPWLLYWQGMARLPFSPAQAAPAFDAAFPLFQAGGHMFGAMLAASGMINAMADQHDFSTIDHWHEVLNDLALRTDDFPGAEIEASVLVGLVIAAEFREKSAGEFQAWKQRLLNIPDTPSTIIAKARAIHWIFHQRILREGCQEALPPLHELQRLSRLPEAPPLVSMIAWASESVYHGFRGAPKEGTEAARKVLELSRETGIHMFDMHMYACLSGSCIDHMDLKGAEAWLDRMHSVGEWPIGSRALYHASLMRIALIRKEYSRAVQELEENLLYLKKSGVEWGDAPILLQQAQVYQMMGDRKKASMLLEKVRADAQARNSDLDMEKVLRTEAQFAFDAGDDARGLLLLEKSLALGRKIGATFLYLGDPATTIDSYERALEAGIEVEYVQELIRRLGFIPEKPPFHIEKWPWPLTVYTLGRFTIIRDGEAIRSSEKAQRTPLRLLKVLISLGGRQIAEEVISEQLWPDADGDLAHHSFETNLYRLRKLLGHAEALLFSDGKLTLDGRYCWVDIWAFENLLGQADEAEAKGDTGKAWELSEKALALYRQDFMAGDSDEVWAISPSERLKAKYFKRLIRLGRSLETAGHIERAVGLYECGLGIDDCMEEIYQRLMICYRHLGKRTKALAVYDRCKKALDAIYGIEPSDETEAIHSEILSQRGRLRLVGTNDRHKA